MIEFKIMTAEDLPFFLEVRNSAREFLHDNRIFSLEECQQWFDQLEYNKKYYLILYENKKIGYFRCCAYYTKDGKPALIIGADLHEYWRGMGLAKDAYRKFIRLQMDQFPGRWLWVELEVLGNNLRAYNLYKDLGFHNTAVTDIIRDGRYIPSIKMGEWAVRLV